MPRDPALSDRADTVRSRRQAWAAPGTGHDRLIRIARVALPAAVVAIFVFLVAAPLTVGRDISFMLSRDRVGMAHERMKVSQAIYRGQDGKGQPFRLTAASAVQRTSADPVVRMRTLQARLALPDGPATVTAPAGRYDMDTQVVAIDGAVALRDTTSYRVDTHDVDIDLNTRRFGSRTAVTGDTPMGSFSGDRVTGDMMNHITVLDGRARLHIRQGRSKGAR